MRSHHWFATPGERFRFRTLVLYVAAASLVLLRLEPVSFFSYTGLPSVLTHHDKNQCLAKIGSELSLPKRKFSLAAPSAFPVPAIPATHGEARRQAGSCHNRAPPLP